MVDNYVAHMDMLGFGNAVLRNFDEAWRALSNLRAAAEEALASKPFPQSVNTSASKWVRHDFFSDSVVFYTAGDSEEDLLAIVVATSAFLAMSLERCVPLRGGIGHGRFQRSPETKNPLVMGESLVKACRIGEAAQWLGVVVEEEIGQRLQTTILRDYAIPWPITGTDGTPLVLNWPKAHAHWFRKKAPIPVEEWYGPFEWLFGDYSMLASDVKRRWENTVAFINAQLVA